MATSQAASSGGTANPIRETIVGTHKWEIDGFSGTKDLGVGKSIKSSTFSVGGHDWYIECYPCGVNKKSAGSVTLFLCHPAHKEQVKAECDFYTTVYDDEGDLYDHHLNGYPYYCTHNAETSSRMGGDVMERAKLESLLNGDDCLFSFKYDDRFPIRCDVSIVREFTALPPPDLHRPLSDLLASGMPGDLATFQIGGELFTLHRGLPGPSTLVAASASTASTAGATTVATICTENNMAVSHVLTIDGYSKAKEGLCCEEKLYSKRFKVGGHDWYLAFSPNENNDTDCLPIFLGIDMEPREAVKVRIQLTLLTLAREVLSFTQSCYAFTSENYVCGCYLPINMEPELSPLQDSFHVKCDVTIVKEITPLRQPDLQLHFGNLLASQVGTDVEFEVGSELFSAHKCVLATRSTAFMAKFFGPAGKGKGSSTTVTRVQIDDMEPGVFKALLHFIYTDTLPDVREDDKVVMAQGLLVAADRYSMERLKLICGDMLCSYINDARMAITTLDLAEKHCCRRLKEACKKFLMDHFAKDAP